jgi:predicted HTH domain antitoxin
MTITIPDSVAGLLGAEAEAKVRLWAAVKGYETRELTAGHAADLAGLSLAEFLLALGRFGVSVFDDLTPEELAHQVEAAAPARSR